MEITSNHIIEYWPIITAVGGFIGAQVVGYILMRQQVADMKAQINGVGSKINSHAKEMETKYTTLYGEVKKLEGYLQGKSEKSI